MQEERERERERRQREEEGITNGGRGVHAACLWTAPVAMGEQT